jgi:hypothetical protein
MQNDGTPGPGIHLDRDDAHQFAVWGGLIPSIRFAAAGGGGFAATDRPFRGHFARSL